MLGIYPQPDACYINLASHDFVTFQCNKCNSAFLIKKSLLLHSQKVHNGPVKIRKRHMCEICGIQSICPSNVKVMYTVVQILDLWN